MANVNSQAESIRDFLVGRLELFDASLDTSEGSALWAQVIAPTFDLLGTDPFDTDIRAFLKDRVTQAFPLVSAQDGDALVDLLITPLEVLLEPFKREIQIIRKGQSARSPDMRLEDARDLAANFFIEWRSGTRASGSVRIYFTAPTYQTVLPTAEFSTAGGLLFYPTRAVTIRPEAMLLNKSGMEYFLDVPLTAGSPSGEHNIAKGSITSVRGVSGFSRLTNLRAFEGGASPETAAELLARCETSLTERTLVVRRGIVARLAKDFSSIVDTEVVGFGDPEMMRDIITGSGEGSVVSSGVCFVVGQFVLMFSTFENRGVTGTSKVSEGDEIELNFWSFLYRTEAGASNERFRINTILFDSRNSITDLPSVLLFRMDGVPSVVAPIAGTLPGVLPGVFAVVRSTGKLEISNIPGGILDPDTLRGTIEVNDNEVHVGGHYDVWLRSANTVSDTVTHETVRSETALLEGSDLVLAGESTTYRHIAHRLYTVDSTTSFRLGETLFCASSKASAVIAEVSRVGAVNTYTLWEMNGLEFAEGDSVTDGTATGTLLGTASTAWADLGVKRGMVLALPGGNEEGAYRILKVDGPFLYLDINLTTTVRSQLFRVLAEVSVNLFAPRTVLIPFGAAEGGDLRTVIGSKTARIGINLQDYGVLIGDTLEILTGDDVGSYTIAAWDTTYGGQGAVLSATMTATNSSVQYKVYRMQPPVQRPLLRVVPSGVVLLDRDGQDSGYAIPNAIPVDVRPIHAFSGAKPVSEGLNGFVLMDPGSGWAPSADYTVDIETYDWAGWTGGDFETFYTDGKFRRAFTDEALSSTGGYVAVISVHGSTGQMYLDSNLPDAAKNFLGDMRSWLLRVIAAFGFGGDAEELVTALSPLKFGPNLDTALPLLLQFEIVIPFEIFDGCNNVYVALPEFDWENEFATADTFGEALGRLSDGAMVGRDPALLQASPGDILTVTSGLNAGSYIIDRVQTYALVNARAVVDGGGAVDLDNAYKVGLVVIRDEFPVPAFYGLEEFFKDGATTWSMPAVADLPFSVTDADGLPVDGWVWVEKAAEWLFQTLNALGFELPSGVSLDVQETLRALWQMLFSSYSVGRPTAAQYLRMYFQEPTSCTVYAPRVCARYQWAPPLPTPADALTGVELTLPLPDLSGLVVSLECERLTGSVPLTGTLTVAFDTAATLEELAGLLQALLDPTELYVSFSGPASATGALSVTQAVGGVDEYLYLSAINLTAGFRVLGFYGPVPAKFPEFDTTSPCAVLYERITCEPGTLLAFDIAIETTLTHIVPVAVFGTAFQIGETVSGGTSSATGTVWAFFDDTTNTHIGHLWISDVSGTFAVGEVITGALSGATCTSSTVEADASLLRQNVRDQVDDVTRTFEEWAELLTAALLDAVLENLGGPTYETDFNVARYSTTLTVSMEFVDQSGTGAGPGRYEVTIYDTTHTLVVRSISVSSPSNTALTDFAVTYINPTLPALSSGGTLLGVDYSPTVYAPVFTTNDGLTETTLAPELTYWEARSFKTAVCDLIDSGDFEEAAQALNALEAWTRTGGARHLFWSSTGTALRLRGIVGGAASTLTGDEYATILGFPVSGSPLALSAAGTTPTSWVAQGRTQAGELALAFERPTPPTLFTGTAGAVELLFTPSDEATAYEVFPGQTEGAAQTAVADLPRDIVIGTPYEGQLAAECVFTDDAHASLLELDVREESDWLLVHEQRRFLEHTDYTALDTDISGDRVVAVTTMFGSNTVRLPDFGGSNEFTFLEPNSGLAFDQVQVGDILFIEEGDDTGGYTVLERSGTALTLDRALTASTERIYRCGRDGVLVVDAEDALFSSADARFTSDDIGRYLTIWASNRGGTDGSYRITAVDSGGSSCTLETEVFAEAENDVHWAVVKAPADELGASKTEGRTALVGLRPLRVYAGMPAELRVVRSSPTLVRAESVVLTALTVSGEVPRSGVRQPYRFVRPGAQHISSTTMSTQRERGLYYFDALSTSLGGQEYYNIPEYTKVEPVFGTYDSDGYRIDVEDNRYTFSTKEEALLTMSAVFLPAGLDDVPSNLVAVSDQNVRFDYEYVPVVAEVQGLLTSEVDRVLCANALARHFLPAYVSLDINYTGGNSATTVTAALRDSINGMSAIDELDLSKLEKVLHRNGVTQYDHPIRLVTLTHDLDRRIVGTQAEGVINDANIAYNGTNRTTFFIAGADASSKEEAAVPAGARIRLTRGSTRSTFR